MNLNNNILNRLSSLYGDSFYLLNSSLFENNYDNFLKEFRNIYPNTFIAYSYKTNYIPKLCSIIKNKNGYAEVVSNMEYDLAIKIGMDPKRIIVNGPYKIKEDLEKMLLQGSLVNLDSYAEIDIVKEIALLNKYTRINIGIRCNFEITGMTHSRFGFDVETRMFYEIIQKLRQIENINIQGLHCHFPTRGLESFKSRVEKITSLSNIFFSSPPEYISIGGGFYGKMDISLENQFSDKIPKYREYAKVIATKFSELYKNVNKDFKPKLFLEPGTVIVANTMKFVVTIKDIKNIRGRYLAITSGSKFNLGLFSSSINLPINVYSRKKSNKDNHFDSIDITGYTCIESDILYKGYNGCLNEGDYIVFDNVGSYSFLFKPPFILPNVAIIDYNYNTDAQEVVKRKENFTDIFRTFFD